MMLGPDTPRCEVAVIVPVHNGASYLPDCPGGHRRPEPARFLLHPGGRRLHRRNARPLRRGCRQRSPVPGDPPAPERRQRRPHRGGAPGPGTGRHLAGLLRRRRPLPTPIFCARCTTPPRTPPCRWPAAGTTPLPARPPRTLPRRKPTGCWPPRPIWKRCCGTTP